MAARITQQVVEVLRTGNPVGRVTQQVVEVLRTGNPVGRVTQQVVEVLYDVLPKQVDDPVIFPGGTTVLPGSVVFITCPFDYAPPIIYYTTDGSDPTEASTEYTAPIEITVDVTIKAKAFSRSNTPSSVVTEDYVIGETMPKTGVKSVVFDIIDNHGSTSYVGIRQIDFLKNGKIVEPPLVAYSTTAHTSYPSKWAFQLDGSQTLDGFWDDSQWLCTSGFVTEQRLTIVFETLVDFDEIRYNNSHSNGGAEDTGSKNVIITTTPDEVTSEIGEEYLAAVTNPSVVFSGAFVIHVSSNVIDNNYIFNTPTPVMSPKGGNYDVATETVVITAEDADTIYFTTDGSTPTDQSSVYSSAITITDEMVIKAFAVQAGKNDSSVLEHLYIDKTEITPTMTSNTAPSGVVSASSEFNTDYKAFEAFDKKYTSSDTWIGGNGVLPSIEEPMWIQYEFPTEETIGFFQFFGRGGGKNNIPKVFTFLGSNNGIDWGTLYSHNDNGRLAADELTEIFKMESVIGYTHYRLSFTSYVENTTSLWVTIGELLFFEGEATQVSLPTFDPVSGAYLPSQEITITCVTTGSTIYYTEDGTDPDETDTEYTGPFELSVDKIIKAIGIKAGLDDSGIVAETYISYIPESRFAKSVILDIADNWGDGNYLNIRSIDFWKDGVKTTLTSGFTAYATTYFDGSFAPELIFNTSLSKIGGSSGNAWATTVSTITNQRVIIVFDTLFEFNSMVVNNAHNTGTETDRGAKNVKINISSEAITDTTYNAIIANSVLIYDGIFDQHISSDVEDAQILTLLRPVIIFSPQNMTGDIIPSPFVVTYSSNYSGREGYKAFDGEATSATHWLANATTGWLQLDLGSGNDEILYLYNIFISTSPEPVTRAPKNWTVEGSDTGAFAGEETLLDTVIGETDWSYGESRQFICDTATTAYRYFRITVTSNDGDASYLQIAEWEMYTLYYSPGTIKFTIDSSKIDDVLTNFPVVFNLTDSSGIGSFDASNFFNHLSISTNRKRIKILTADGYEECYAEIEPGYDFVNRKMVLHVLVPEISDSVDTDLYLFFNKNWSDNVSYIGDTGDTPAKEVWDANFKGVYHMSNDPSGGAGCILESTVNSYNATPNGSMTVDDLIDAGVGLALDLDGTDDFISCPSDVCIVGVGDFTTEIKAKTLSTVRRFLISQRASGNANPSYTFEKPNTNKLNIQTYDGATQQDYESVTSINDNVYHHLVVVREGGNTFKLAIDSPLNSGSTEGVAVSLTAVDLHIGNWTGGDYYWLGPIAEVRFSDIARSSSWVYATGESLDDTLTTLASVSRVLTPTINPISGQYPEGATAEITCGTPASTIYYTTDGSNPNTGSSVYTVPIEITNGMVLKAFATSLDYPDSEIASETYTISSGGVQQQMLFIMM